MQVQVKFNDLCKTKAAANKMSKKDIDMLVVCKIENEFGYPE
jgi:hypothetical protein